MAIDPSNILGIFQAHPDKSFRLSELMERAGVGKHKRRDIQNIVRRLRGAGEIQLLHNKRYQLSDAAHVIKGPGKKSRGGEADLVVGRLSVSSRGFGFVRRADDDEERGPGHRPDIYIARDCIGEGLHGDLVLTRILERSDPKRPEGRVISVLRRGLKHIVGRFHRMGRKGGVVVPRNQRLGRNVYIVAPPPPDDLSDATWVTVRLTEYPPPPDDLVGEVDEILGDDQTQGIDILMVLRDYGIIDEFPEEVLNEAAALHSFQENDLTGRKDLRDLPTFTIDGYDAKDYDDALSVEIVPGGGHRLYVHIADVAHYVRPETALDAEAFRRSTSIYPVDRVVPMLPEALSNDLCSLRPNEDRLTITVEMDVTRSGQVEDYRIYESVIRSNLRLNYRDVQSFFDGIKNPSTRRLEKISGDMRALYDLMELFRERRLERGALDLDLPEVEIEFDEVGVVENVVRAPRWDSHKIIEECMILANEVVAEHMEKCAMPFLYRVHDKPNADELGRLSPILEGYGIPFVDKGQDAKAIAARIQEALAATEEMEAPHIFCRIILRSLAKACYAPANIGHFGLASSSYTHFTSPIRRYPDLLLHRVLKKVLQEEKPDSEWLENMKETLDGIGEYCSEMERLADAIESEASRICALSFMRGRLGEAFQGHVSGVTNYGLFVELRKYPVDGLLHVRDLHDDRYEFDEATMILKGRRSGRIFRMGQSVEVLVHRVDVLNQEMDLRLALLEESHPRRGGRLYQSRRRRAW